MDKQYLETEFHAFFEFDSDDRSVVTSTSAKMFAEHMAAPIEAQVEQLTTALKGVLPFLTGEYWPGVVADAAVDRAIAAVRIPDDVRHRGRCMAPPGRSDGKDQGQAPKVEGTSSGTSALSAGLEGAYGGKALEILLAMATLAADSKSLTVAEDWGFGSATPTSKLTGSRALSASPG